MDYMSTTQLHTLIVNVQHNPEAMKEILVAVMVGIISIRDEAVRYLESVTSQIQVRIRIPMSTSAMSGQAWVDELLNGHPLRCFNALKMKRDTFLLLCHVPEYKYMTDNNTYTSVQERVAWFLRTLSHRCANRDSMERFRRSGSTISGHFGDVREAVGRIGADYVKPRDRTFQQVQEQIRKSSKYYPLFKDCIGALDGCHVELTVPAADNIRFINRKGVTSTNVLVVYDFDMLFIFVCSGWEGSTHDTRVFLSSVNDATQNYPNPPPSKYYLGDKGYPDRIGLMTPHTRVRYHQSKFRAEDAIGGKGKFNKCHSSARSVTNRAFGVLNARFQILRKVPSYPLLKQIKIVNACFALHNFIKISHHGDPAFTLVDNSPSFIPEVDEINPSVSQQYSSANAGTQDYGRRAMVQLKETLTQELMSRSGGR